MSDPFVVIRIAALDHVEKTFAAGNVEALAFGVEKQIVRVALKHDLKPEFVAIERERFCHIFSS